MNSAKEEVRSLLRQLPDTCTMEDIQYHLYVVEKIRHAQEAVESQGAVSQDEAEKQLARWLAA